MLDINTGSSGIHFNTEPEDYRQIISLFSNFSHIYQQVFLSESWRMEILFPISLHEDKTFHEECDF